MNDTTPSTETTQVICPATRDTGIRLLIMAAMMIGYGLYCFTDWGKSKYDAPAAWDMKHINEAARHVLTYYVPFVLIPPGLAVAAFAVRSMRRRLLADAEGIGYAGKDKLPWSAVTRLDASDLADKQILRIEHGSGQSMVLDGYELQNFKQLVAFVESHVPRERV